ncbi:hypothetical protein GCM10010112_81930 [Actinoplanes lobatus]|uniref:Uncharacterized protein n=1 Tax=Actinoplanes lobatus TaxID=113568 RepID=A0A7W7HLC1_9ACTN|nr:hypothetical protein [Actinoplanes lobatus]MBB4752606.1 hypothetical protein [Actinoplanes lobatus]GGN93555.1 hypothetical protein GCM10010112_81930 [Actinoplanes lobatus]GIE44727.1 hypothetical protein Alo02nite_76250 [Actinoplanes lobatus]
MIAVNLHLHSWSGGDGSETEAAGDAFTTGFWACAGVAAIAILAALLVPAADG